MDTIDERPPAADGRRDRHAHCGDRSNHHNREALMLDRAMAEFEAAMQAKARARPRRASTKRNAEIDQSSPAGAAELGRCIRAFWAAAGFDNIRVEVFHAGGPRESPVYGVRSDMIGGLPAALRADARKS
jgi:hypothetical protein